jgi:hypothetical protein
LGVLGLFGVFYFVAMIISILRGLKWMKIIEKKYPKSSFLNMRMALIAMISCLAIHGLVDSIGYYSREVIVIFCSMAFKWYSLHEKIADQKI